MYYILRGRCPASLKFFGDSPKLSLPVQYFPKSLPHSLNYVLAGVSPGKHLCFHMEKKKLDNALFLYVDNMLNFNLTSIPP